MAQVPPCTAGSWCLLRPDLREGPRLKLPGNAWMVCFDKIKMDQSNEPSSYNNHTIKSLYKYSFTLGKLSTTNHLNHQKLRSTCILITTFIHISSACSFTWHSHPIHIAFTSYSPIFLQHWLLSKHLSLVIRPWRSTQIQQAPDHFSVTVQGRPVQRPHSWHHPRLQKLYDAAIYAAPAPCAGLACAA